MTDPGDITVPTAIQATCPDCGELRFFNPTDHSADPPTAIYKCNGGCGERLTLVIGDE